MRKLILERKISTDNNKRREFAFWPTIALEAHPTHHKWHLIWWEVYEIDYGKKWVTDPLES